MENFEDSSTDDIKSSSFQNFLNQAGPLIKEARENQNISPEKLAKSLRIGEEQLLAIEECQEDLLPEAVFVKAMIRRISEKLNLNITNLESSSYQRESLRIKHQSQEAIKATSRTIYIFLIAIISLCLGVLCPRIMVDYLNMPKETTHSVPKSSKTIQKEPLSIETLANEL